MLPILSRAGAELETRANGIQDPVERLRFLRSATFDRGWCGEKPPELPEPANIRKPRRLRLAWLAVGATLALAPVRPSGSAGTFERERMLLTAPTVVSAAENPAASPAPPHYPGAGPNSDPNIVPGAAPPRVWRVEQSETSETYSNGLHIDLTYQTSNRPRAQYPIYSLTGAAAPLKTSDRPAGIVFHTTESLIAPFEEEQNRRLRQIGRNLLEWVRQERAYHYVIDRFGRVFAVVVETDAANHAGRSIWAGPEGIYVNLNDSFLSISFEAQTDATDAVTPAQIASGKLLTDMLRSRYGIDAANCVTHAQVSVNPRNMKIGEHTDWASDFPFTQIGLPDNYAIPLASLYVFGFKYDDAFIEATRNRWKGLELSDEQVAQKAALENMTIVRYRAMLRRRFEAIDSQIEPVESEAKQGAEVTAK